MGRLRRGSTFAIRRATPELGSDLAAAVRTLAKDLFDPYRPELHYMRGPGPKWRAKHTRPPIDATSDVTGMHQAAV